VIGKALIGFPVTTLSDAVAAILHVQMWSVAAVLHVQMWSVAAVLHVQVWSIGFYNVMIRLQQSSS
jgi:hypothetical protein